MGPQRPQKSEEGGLAALEASRRSESHKLTHEHAKIEGRIVDKESFENVCVAA